MKKRWVFVSVLIALALGAGTGLLFGRTVQAPLRLALSCLLLSEAERAGYLNREKQGALIEKLSTSPSLQAADRQFVPRLRSECSKM